MTVDITRRTTIVLTPGLVEGLVPRAESINDYTERSPMQPPVYPKDKLFFLPRSELVVIPINATRDGQSWDVIVVGAPKGDTYQPGGHRLSVGSRELAGAIELKLDVRHA